MPNGRCYRHGGASHPPGQNHPTYRHGARSKLRLNHDLARRLNEAAADPDLMTVNRDVEALEARLGELLEQIDTAGSAEFFGTAAKVIAAFKATDADALRELIPIFEQQLSPEVRKFDNWREIERFSDSKRKLIESHHKRQAEAGQMILMAQHAMMMDRLVSAALEGMIPGEIAMARRLQSALAQLMGVYDQPASGGAIEVEASASPPS